MFFREQKIIRNNAFTLIEIIIAISITAIISVGIVFVFNSGIDAWVFGRSQAEIQKTASSVLENIIEGQFRYDGLREIIEITNGNKHSISFIPWFIQKVRKIETGKKIALEFPVNSNSTRPVGQVWNNAKSRYEISTINFFPYSKDFTKKKNFVSFTDKQNNNKKGRILYYPVTTDNADLLMSIYFDVEKKNIFRQYQGVVKPIIKMSDDILIEDFRIEFLDGVNKIIDYQSIVNLSPLNNPVTAMRLSVRVAKGSENYTLRSFVNIRKKRLASEGVLMTKGSSLSIPDSFNIKTLSAINFLGIEKNSFVYFKIFSQKLNQTLCVRVTFEKQNEMPFIKNYRIEHPKGRVVFSNDANVPANRGVNFLTMDYSGMYDYDSDQLKQGEITFLSDDVQLVVEESSIMGVYVLVR